MNYSVVVSSWFKKDLKQLYKKYPSIKNDISELVTSLETDPFQGIPLGKNCYKIRISISSKGKGKSGGGRVITCVKVLNKVVYLLAMFDKSEKENLSDKEIDLILKSSGL